MRAPGPFRSRWFSWQIDEIRSDRALTFYGIALAAAHLLTSIQWQFRSGVSLMIGGDAARLCWPFFENCHAFGVSVWTVHYALWAFFLLSGLAGLCFLVRKVSAGYWLLMLVTTIRLVIMVRTIACARTSTTCSTGSCWPTCFFRASASSCAICSSRCTSGPVS